MSGGGSKEYFDKVSGEWDRMQQGFFSEAVRDKAISTAQVEGNETAIDLGAGSGFVTEALLEKGLNVIAIDQSSEMIDVLQKKFDNSTKLDCRQGNAENLPIENDVAEYVFGNMYLHHVEDPLEAIKEAVRTLKKGGKLIITDLYEHNYDFLRIEHHDRWLGFKRNDVAQWFRQAGLKNVTVTSVGESCCAQSECSDNYADINIFLAYGER